MPKELEIKLIITERCAERDKAEILRKLGKPVRTELQKNYYFASVRGSMVRLRIADSAALLTLKRGGKRKGGFFSCEETESAVERCEAFMIIESGCLQKGDYSGIRIEADKKLLGMTANTRHFYKDFVLDFTDFPDGHSEAEIEVEVPHEAMFDAALKRISALLASKGLTFSEQKETKFARFLKSLRRAQARKGVKNV